MTPKTKQNQMRNAGQRILFIGTSPTHPKCTIFSGKNQNSLGGVAHSPQGPALIFIGQLRIVSIKIFSSVFGVR